MSLKAPIAWVTKSGQKRLVLKRANWLGWPVIAVPIVDFFRGQSMRCDVLSAYPGDRRRRLWRRRGQAARAGRIAGKTDEMDAIAQALPRHRSDCRRDRRCVSAASRGGNGAGQDLALWRRRHRRRKGKRSTKSHSPALARRKRAASRRLAVAMPIAMPSARNAERRARAPGISTAGQCAAQIEPRLQMREIGAVR